MLKELFRLNKMAFAPFINLNYQSKTKHNMYEKGEKATPYVENVVESVERFNKNTSFRAKNNVNYDENPNINPKHQDNSFSNEKGDFVPRRENYNFDNEITIRKNIFEGDEKTHSDSVNTYFNNDINEQSKEQRQNNDILEELSDNLEFLSRRGVYLK